MQESPIGWVGGKRRLRGAVLARMSDHEVYVEAFAGAAWVLFGKDAAKSSVEIVNDVNGELTNFYRCVREKPLELVEKIKFRLICQADFYREREMSHEQGSEIDRAARFFWLLKVSFGAKQGKAATFGYRLTGGKPRFRSEFIYDIVERAHKRLQHVQVFNEDFQVLIERLDRPTTFFYCDPPYYGTKRCYVHEFSEEDHRRLARVLKGIKGKFVLSYGNCEQIRTLYSWARIDEVTTRYGLANRSKGATPVVTELLIRNY